MSQPEQLDLSLNGERLAVLDDLRMGFVGLTFTELAFDRYGEGARVLSLSLPVSRDVSVEGATQFLRGLLPEGRTLEWVAQQRRLSTNDTFGLLRELGRDTAGALVIAPPDVDVDRADEVDWLTETGLAEWIRTLPDHPLGLDPAGEVRLSLAGVQDKLVVCVHPETEAIGRPLHGTPSTHILKPRSLAVDGVGRPRTPDIVENEAFCMRLAVRAGLPVAASSIRRVDHERTLLIERYDRLRQGEQVVRIHQEDACQALAIDPLHKYESNGGPSLASIAKVIRDFAAEPLRDLYRLLDITTLNVVVGNLDAHGKNISFLHHANGTVSLAPGYDILSAAAYPVFAEGTLAMHVGDADRLESVDADSLLRAYAACGLSERVARRRLPNTIETIEDALAQTPELALGEGWHTPLLDEIAEQARQRIVRLALP